MWSIFRKKKAVKETSYWKEDFTDCETRDYLPDFSICRCKNSRNCRFISIYSNVFLCNHPNHKSFIPPDSEPYDPHKNLV